MQRYSENKLIPTMQYKNMYSSKRGILDISCVAFALYHQYDYQFNIVTGQSSLFLTSGFAVLQISVNLINKSNKIKTCTCEIFSAFRSC